MTPHFECEVGQGPGGIPSTKGCILETKDAGATWRILEGAPPAGEGASQWIIDADTWLWSAYFEGMWRTANGGATWDPVIDKGTYSTANGVRVPGREVLFWRRVHHPAERRRRVLVVAR